MQTITQQDCILAATKALDYLEATRDLVWSEKDQEFLGWLISHEFLPHIEKWLSHDHTGV
jgi:hypothetical protein